MAPESESTSQTETVVEAPKKELPPHSLMQNDVRTELKDSGGTIMEMVVTKLVNEELNIRAKKVADGLLRLRSAHGEVNKNSKPDVKYLSGDGTTTFEGFSAPRLKALTDAKHRLKEIADAIDVAIKASDYTKLDKILAQAAGKPTQEAAD